MTAMAPSDWHIRIVQSRTEGFRHQCFADAVRGAVVNQLPMNPPVPVFERRLVTRWKDTQQEAHAEIERLIGRLESGVP